jgi:hypothetical protein
MTAPRQLVQKLWKTCTIRRDDGQSFRLILKMAEERAGGLGLLASTGFAGRLA